MPVIVYGPMPCLPRTAHWVRLANEPKVTFAAVVDSKTGDNALTGATGTKRASRTTETMSADTRLNVEYDR